MRKFRLTFLTVGFKMLHYLQSCLIVQVNLDLALNSAKYRVTHLCLSLNDEILTSLL